MSDVRKFSSLETSEMAPKWWWLEPVRLGGLSQRILIGQQCTWT